MAKRILLELEKGNIEFNDDGETQVYTYQDTPMNALSDEQKQEIRDSAMMQNFVMAINEVANQLAIAFENAAKVAVPILNKVAEQIQAAHAEMEKAKAAKKKPAKKAKTDEAK